MQVDWCHPAVGHCPVRLAVSLSPAEKSDRVPAGRTGGRHRGPAVHPAAVEEQVRPHLQHPSLPALVRVSHLHGCLHWTPGEELPHDVLLGAAGPGGGGGPAHAVGRLGAGVGAARITRVPAPSTGGPHLGTRL